MSVADDFRAFRSNYLIPANLVGTISYRYKRITKQLNKDFWNTESESAHSFYVGSYGRDSAAQGVSDLDVAFHFSPPVFVKYENYIGNGQSALLQAIRFSIQKTYPITRVGGDGQVVAVDFDDGITFEILPVFNGNDGAYLFPDSNSGGCWKLCYPKKEIAAFLARDKYTANGNLKAICRMARIWKQRHNVPIGGMLIDTLAYQFVLLWEYRDKSFMYHDYLVRDFMKYLANSDKDRSYWRAPGSNSFVHKKGNFQRHAKIAYENTLSAIDHQINKRPYSCREKWREIFGPTFA
ncbi:SMODS domain-containing nucleotidyltransferase [Parasphingorhabdus sp.]|uniref:SMODS domain-containing nucleotidyltransferase n=1 Tax=Parasphingorhabdus sp. TaxID=2709688 RepID=UPI003BAF5222